MASDTEEAASRRPTLNAGLQARYEDFVLGNNYARKDPLEGMEQGAYL